MRVSNEGVIASGKNDAYLGWAPISWSSGKSHMAETSSYEGQIQAVFYGCYTVRFLKISVADFLFGNEGVDVETRVRNGNSSV